ncbi:MAG TPA: hypothetical protein P5534_11930 [Candidatus Paceibacterota bacterium]|nr:hypothetical protein [Candidatus Paceibacterota bacterium]HRZ55545.1 hypothetical protein [Candidatus Paceibacterota bacterium]
MNQAVPPRKGRGCFFYGCLTLVVVVILGLAGLYLGVRSVAKQVIQRYTDSSPMTLPAVEISAEEAAAAQQQFKAFQSALDAGTPAEPLVLGGNEINALIAAAPDFAMLKDRVHIAIDGDQVKGQISYPLDELPLPWFARMARGRYLNGSAGLSASMTNGALLVTIQSLEVKGEAVPEQFMAGLRQQNLAQNVYKDANSMATLRKIESIAIKDGKLEIKARAGN